MTSTTTSPRPRAPSPTADESQRTRRISSPVEGAVCGSSSYRPLRLLASGGRSEVFLAAAESGGLVVLKRFGRCFRDAEAAARFRRAAEVAASLEHPNIARIHEIVVEDTACTIVTEYVSGEDVRTLLRSAGRTSSPIPFQVSCAIVDGAAAALAAAHEGMTAAGAAQTIVHGDVSPSNLIVSYAGRVKVVDFGLAAAMDREELSDRAGRRGRDCYSSPEQLDGRAVDHRADLFALGVVAWEMLTSRQPFTGSNDGEIARIILEGHIPPPSIHNAEIRPEVDEIVLALLRRDPAGRMSSARELRRALARHAGFDESPEELVARWMTSAFAAAHAQRMALEWASFREATQRAPRGDLDLPVAFPEPERRAIRTSPDEPPPRGSSSHRIVLAEPRILPAAPAAPAAARPFSRRALVAMWSAALFVPPLFAVLLRACRSDRPSAPPPAELDRQEKDDRRAIPEIVPTSSTGADAGPDDHGRLATSAASAPPETTGPPTKTSGGGSPPAPLQRDRPPDLSSSRARRGEEPDAAHSRRRAGRDERDGPEPRVLGHVGAAAEGREEPGDAATGPDAGVAAEPGPERRETDTNPYVYK